MGVWLVVLVLAIVCFVLGFTLAAKVLFLAGLVLLVVAAAGGAKTRRRGLLGGGRPLGRRRWGRRRSLL
jgi:hypothetical protein